MKIALAGEQLELLPQKGIYWERDSTLILSDLHLGKAGHFRKHGIPIPQHIHHDDLRIVSELIVSFAPKSVIFLGDLFHSDLNAEWWAFIDWLEGYTQIQFILIKGNHDIIPSTLFEHAKIKVLDQLEVAPFYFTHIKEIHPIHYNLSGHVHPGVRLYGAGKQGVTLPCFQFCDNYGLLPAFGNFTGLAKIRPKATDRIFVIAEDRILDVSP